MRSPKSTFCIQRVLEKRADSVQKMPFVQKCKVYVLSQCGNQRCIEKACQRKPKTLQPRKVVCLGAVCTYHTGTHQNGKKTEKVAQCSQERNVHGIHGATETGKPHPRRIPFCDAMVRAWLRSNIAFVIYVRVKIHANLRLFYI